MTATLHPQTQEQLQSLPLRPAGLNDYHETGRTRPWKEAVARWAPSASLLTTLLTAIAVPLPVGAQARNDKWTGPPITGPLGGQTQISIYYGPWQCRQDWLSDCEKRCASERYESKGCMWLADIKVDWETRFGPWPMHGGGRLAIVHCCCSYTPVKNSSQLRGEWENARKSFRRRWGEEFGTWPVDEAGNSWPGHHIRDLLHGGDPVAERNVIPVHPQVHDVFNKEYPLCYAGGGKWNTAYPHSSLPYKD
jgi:hypothetical protein